ncbi:MAG: efflux RND transporter permease subunit [Candidatus Paceibacterota bacterium]
MTPLWSFFIHKKQFTLLLLVVLVILGLNSLMSIPKESAPEVQIPIGIVTTILQNASAEDIEKLITNPLEDGLINLENVKNISSVSRVGVSSITVEFEANADIDESIDALKDEVDALRIELPRDAEIPRVSDVNFADQPIMYIAISSDATGTALTDLGQSIKTELQSLQGVSRVAISGTTPREISIIVDKNKLTQFNLSLGDITSAISAHDVTTPIGTIETNGIVYTINFNADINEASEFGDISLRNPQGGIVFLRDVALISNDIGKTRTLARLSLEGLPAEQAILATVFKNRGTSILDVADSVEEKVAELTQTTLQGSSALTFFNSADYVRQDLKNLTTSGLQTVLLVIGLLLITIGWRESLVAGLAIPLSFLISFIGLNLSGNTINFISLFSLILAVGILVDSAIVITEAMHGKLKNWNDKTQSALEVIDEYAWPLISGTMTTVAVFVPLFFISGITGKFIASIPFTIVFVLSASLIVALAIIPLIASLFLRRRTTSKIEVKQEELTHKLQEKYKGLLTPLLISKKKQRNFFALLAVLFFVTLSFPILGIVTVIFFPESDEDFVFVNLEKPEGTVLPETDFSVRAVEEALYGNTYIESFITTVGEGSSFVEGSGGINTKLANITINLYPERDISSNEFVDMLREDLSHINTITSRISQISSGPPTGKPIGITFSGNDTEALESSILLATKILSEIPGTSDITTSTRGEGTEFALTIRRDRVTSLGLSPLAVAQTLRTAVSGATVSSVRNGDTDVDVVVRLNLNTEYQTSGDLNNVSIDALRELPLQTPTGETVLLGSLIEVSPEKSATSIRHEDRKRIATISADIRSGANLREINTTFIEQMDEVALPDGITYSLGGENEEQTESFIDMFFALIFGLILMLAILVMQFNSFKQTAFILSVVPLTSIGVLAGLAITGRALSFPSLLGFITLAGIVVNNAIILIDSINRERKKPENKTLLDAVVAGSTLRLRPVLLTTVTTVVGVIPLLFASDIWGPLAYTIMFGLAFATVLTLLLIPTLYYRYTKEEVAHP